MANPTDSIEVLDTWTEIPAVDTWMSLSSSEIFQIYVGASTPTVDDAGIRVQRVNLPVLGANLVWVRARDGKVLIQVLPQG